MNVANYPLLMLLLLNIKSTIVIYSLITKYIWYKYIMLGYNVDLHYPKRLYTIITNLKNTSQMCLYFKLLQTAS